jgi:molybdopterin-synthase adenylyltransferase
MRYSRQIVLKEIGKNGQKALAKKTIVIIGLGALGTVSAELLTRAGIGKLILVDNDIIALDNLQRQVLYDEEDVGKPKVLQAENKLKKINSNVKIESYTRKLNANYAEMLLRDADLVLDCTDNFEARFVINDYCVKNKKPWIYTAAIKTKGTLMNIIPGGPCIGCFVKDSECEENCETEGILSSATVTIASMQVVEALKILLNKDYETKMVRVDIWDLTLDKIKVNKKKGCECCDKHNFKYLEIPAEDKFIIKKCKTRVGYNVKPKGSLRINMNFIKNNFEVLEDAKIAIVIKVDGEELVIQSLGTIYFKGTKDINKISNIAKKVYNLK